MSESPRLLHHGTMMMHVNTQSLEKYLVIDKEKLINKGADTVKSRIMNL